MFLLQDYPSDETKTKPSRGVIKALARAWKSDPVASWDAALSTSTTETCRASAAVGDGWAGTRNAQVPSANGKHLLLLVKLSLGNGRLVDLGP